MDAHFNALSLKHGFGQFSSRSPFPLSRVRIHKHVDSLGGFAFLGLLSENRRILRLVRTFLGFGRGIWLEVEGRGARCVFIGGHVRKETNNRLKPSPVIAFTPQFNMGHLPVIMHNPDLCVRMLAQWAFSRCEGIASMQDVLNPSHVDEAWPRCGATRNTGS